MVVVPGWDGGGGGAGRGAADGVVEEQDAVCAGQLLEQEGFDFRVVDLLDVCVVREGGFGGGDVRESGEGVAVEREGGLVAAQVGDGDGDVDGVEVALRLAGRGRFDVVEGFGAV